MDRMLYPLIHLAVWHRSARVDVFLSIGLGSLPALRFHIQKGIEMGVVYLATNKVNGKRYVGWTARLKKRKWVH
jgi:hypothetical protein